MLKVLNKTDSAATIMLHGEFGWDFDSASVSRELADIEAEKLIVKINSPGGDAFAGIAIMNALRDHPAHVTCVVEGLAASAASIVAVGGSDELIMRPQSQLMIHDAMIYASGDAGDLREAISLLEKTSESIAEVYQRKAGGTVEDWREAMRVETWFTADEAVEAGLADRVEDGQSATPTNFKLLNKFAGRRAKPAAALLNARGYSMENIELLNSNIEKLIEIFSGLRSDVAPVSNKVDEAEKRLEEARTKSADTEPVAETEKVEEPQGVLETVTIDRATYEELTKAAQMGWEAKEQAAAKEREAEVNAWIKDGRISANSREAAMKLMNTSPESARATFGSNPKNTIPRREVGHGIDTAEVDKGGLTARAAASGLFTAPSF